MAERDFETLLATIKQLNAQIDELNGKINKTRQELSTLQDPAAREKAGRSLGGYTTAARTKETELTSAKSAVRAQLDAINAQLFVTEQRIKQLSLTEIQEGSGVAAQLAKELQLRRELSAEAERMNNLVKQRPISPLETLISHGTKPSDGSVSVNDAEKFGTTLARGNRGYTYALPTKGQLKMDLFPDIPSFAEQSSKGNTWSTWEEKASARQRMTNAQRIAQEELEKIKALQDSIKADKRYAAAIRVAEKQGYSIDDLKSVRTRGTGGINQLQFERYNELGIKQNLDIFSSKSGRATPGISNQFRTFGQGVLRDIGELTKWSLALAAVYGPMQKLGELTQEMIANQTKLAEATVSVSSAFVGQSQIFDISAEAADAYGESITGVIDAFTQSYRAAGGGADQVERLTTAQKLLNDSLTLSKLSTLDQAGAIDTLAAALRQSGDALEGTGNSLQKGSQLLDKWVRVTKVANVDLATLATGFAVLGDAAESAGIGVDELNGIIAAIAETGVASGKEVANTARAIVSGFQSDQARKELESLGIAVEDSTGKMRPFLEIMQEISNLRKGGVIDDTQFSKLTLALGGGTRRQAAYTTFIENFSRVYDVATESANAHGDAQAALAKQLDTVQTSLTKLANAFTTLAQTMGSEGGFLDIMSLGIKGATGLVNIFNSLVAVLGKATPAMAAFIAASAVLKYKGLGSPQQYLGNLVPQTSPTTPEGQFYLPGMGPLTPGQKAGNFANKYLFGTNMSSSISQGVLLSALPAITNLMNARNGTDKYGGVKAGADVIGGVGGAIVGTLVAGSPLIGAAVGTAISEAFVNSTIARKTDIFGYNTGPALGESFVPSTTTDKEAALRQAETNLYQSIGGGNEAFGKFLTSGTEKLSKTLVEQLNDAIKNQDQGRLEDILGKNGVNSNINSKDVLAQVGITPEFVRNAFSQGKPIEFSPGNAAYNRASDQARREYDAALKAYKATQETATDTPFAKMVAENEKSYRSTLDLIKASSKSELGQQRLAGDIKGSDYARRTGALAGFDTKALQYYTALGDQFIKINDNVDNAEEAFQAFNEIILSGTGDTVPEITQIVAEIQKLINILNDPALQSNDALASLGFKNLDEVKSKLTELQGTGANLLTDVYKQSQLVGLNIPQIEGNIGKPLTSQENTLVEQRTKKLQDTFYQGFLELPDAMYDALKDSFDEFAVTIKDSGDEFYKSVTETDQQFRQAAIQQLQEEGKIKSQKEDPFNIQQLDITSQQGANLQGQINYFSQYLASNFPQYKQNPEDVGVIFSDYVTDVLHGDNLAIKLALEKIVDLNQKQLDGMYNIPEGATFWVPLTAAYYKPKNEGGGASIPSLDTGAVDTNTSATEANTQALMAMTDKWSNADPYLFKRPPEPHEDRYDKMNKVEEPITKYAPGGLASPLDRAYALGGGVRRLEDIKKFFNDYGKTVADNPQGAAVGYRGDPGYSRQQESQTGSFIQQLLDGVKNFFNGIGSQYPYRDPGSKNPSTSTTMPVASSMTQQAAPTVQARMDLRFDNSVQLIVDGRVLASVVTPYLASDLIKMEASQGTITKRYVI